LVAVEHCPVLRPELEQLLAPVRACLSGLQAGDIEIECLESQRIQESSAALACLHALKANGHRIALDDFGAGYSNLNYLCRRHGLGALPAKLRRGISRQRAGRRRLCRVDVFPRLP
ncbi:EAL domain-containing protein, partial [Serratia ureilytica]|nr:EAL domain-containing protein [Serratia ureilytica]